MTKTFNDLLDDLVDTSHWPDKEGAGSSIHASREAVVDFHNKAVSEARAEGARSTHGLAGLRAIDATNDR